EDDGCIKIFDAVNAKQVGIVKAKFYDASLNHDGTKIVTRSATSVDTWNNSGKKIATMCLETPSHQFQWAESAEFSADGTKVLVAYKKNPQIFDADTGKLLAEFKGRHKNTVKSAQFLSNGTIISHSQNRIIIWGQSTCAPLVTIKHPDIESFTC